MNFNYTSLLKYRWGYQLCRQDFFGWGNFFVCCPRNFKDINRAVEEKSPRVGEGFINQEKSSFLAETVMFLSNFFFYTYFSFISTFFLLLSLSCDLILRRISNTFSEFWVSNLFISGRTHLFVLIFLDFGRGSNLFLTRIYKYCLFLCYSPHIVMYRVQVK